MSVQTAIGSVFRFAGIRWVNRVNWQSATLIATAGIVFYLVLGPLLVAFVATFREKDVLPFEPGAFTLVNYSKVFLDPATWTLFINTTLFAAGSLFVGMTVAVIFSWLVERSDVPFRELMFALIVAPMAIPGVLAAIAWVFLLDPRIGLLNLWLRWVPGLEAMEGPLNIYTLWGMIFVEGIRMVPTMFLMISGAFRSMDPSLEEASRVAGKTTLSTAFRVTLPLMRPAILAAMIYYFIVVMEVFEIPGILGMNAGIHVFATRIYWAAHPPVGGLPDYGLASTLGLILVVISLFFIWLYYRLTRRSYSFVTVTGKGFRPHRIELGRWKYAAAAVCIAYFLVALAFPLLILFWVSVQRFYVPPSWEALSSVTFESYWELLEGYHLGLALFNTIFLGLLTATATMVIAFFVGWFSVRVRTRLCKALDIISFLPHALPSVVVALAVMLLYLSFNNPFYGTIVLISIALTVRFLAFGSRTMAAGFLQIHPELEEAARVSGGNMLKTYGRILLPLAAPAFINGWIWVAVHAARELTAALMLYTPESVVLSTSLWVLWEEGEKSIAAALGVILVLALIFLNWLGRLMLLRLRSF